MKKVLTFILVAGLAATSLAQIAIPGVVFSDAPARFNGRKVTVKNIQVGTHTQNSMHSAVAPMPLGGTVQATPGAIGPAQQTAPPCRPPRGFAKLNVTFLEKLEFKGCFFMVQSMYDQLQREIGGQMVDAQITFRGDYRTGYNVSFYRLGK